MKTIDLVVPCYNEEAGLEHFVLETNKVIDSLPEYSFRYILVNDGSKDRTYLIMKSLRKLLTISSIFRSHEILERGGNVCRTQTHNG